MRGLLSQRLIYVPRSNTATFDTEWFVKKTARASRMGQSPFSYCPRMHAVKKIMNSLARKTPQDLSSSIARKVKAGWAGEDASEKAPCNPNNKSTS